MNIKYADFQKMEIKIGKVVSAERAQNAGKLILFEFDFGNEKKQVVAGMAEFFDDISGLMGKEMPVIVNLEPRKFMGYESQGMILAVDVSGKPILLQPEEAVPPGSIVR